MAEEIYKKFSFKCTPPMSYEKRRFGKTITSSRTQWSTINSNGPHVAWLLSAFEIMHSNYK